ncbi:MAG: carbohydrate-binding domain-containing protein, partial [Clostridia bacterium]|nr:carbohydrate-binding domain-containing protein [Clostridia bacterium]
STAPIVVKKSSTVNIHLEGSSTITDNEDPDDEDSSDATVADAFEGAAIKVKSGSTLTFCGDGDLSIVANAKNGIKGGSTAALIFNQSGTITVSGGGSYYGGTKSGAAVNNGIACDGSLVFNQGSFVIKAAGDGIKSAPDATDETEGTTIDTDSAGTVTINGGTFDIDADGDGIQADTALIINGGTFDIQTWKGYGVWNDTLADAYSCKGLKASGDRAEEAGIDPTITITGGTFTINAGDDAVHSDAYATIAGGVFNISTGDDGMHADTSLILGMENGNGRDPDVTINASYEGLEGGTVYMFSGRYYVVASDDGVNAAGGSSNGSDQGGGGGNTFNPGGGGPGGGRPGGPGSGGTGGGSSSSGDYNIYIYGGDLYVNCSGDGLDSNGGLYLYGGTQAVFSMASGGDNSAIDADGTILIQGAEIFTAGTAGMDGTASSSWFGSNQKYYASKTSYSSGRIINTKAGSSGSVIFSYKLPKAVNYIMASWPTSLSSSTPSFTTATSVTNCKGGSWSHTWDSGAVTTAAASASAGTVTYTCEKCGATEIQTIPMTVEIAECDHSVEVETEADEGYTVTFAGDEGVASVTVYETQDYAGANESVAANGATVSRDSSTGEPDSSGSGQVNFTVVLEDGYEIESVSVSGGYKNLKGPDDTGTENTYRVTKITSELIITITCTKTEEENTDPILNVENFTVSITNASGANCVRYASGVHTTASSIRAASDLVTYNERLIAQYTDENGTFSVDLRYSGYYTFWI